ncbi:MAG: bile acid:sodium symporter family protein, partial [Fusobacteriaceae bacterium]
ISMFGMGMTLTEKDFEVVIKNYKDVIIGFLAQFTIMPFVAFGIAKLLNLPPELAIGLILIGSCPGGVTSNVLTYLAKGDVPLSLSMTSVSTLMAPIMTPILTFLLAGAWIKVSIYGMFLSIVQVILVPVIAGILARHVFKKFVTTVGVKISPFISAISVIIIAGAVVSSKSSTILENGFIILIAIIIHNLLGYSLGYFVANKFGMSQKKCRTVSIEVGVQNSGLATTLAMVHFTPVTAVAGVVGVVWHIFSGAILANYWNTKPLKEKK